MTRWEKVKAYVSLAMSLWAWYLAARYMDKPEIYPWAVQYAWIGMGWLFVAETIKTLARLRARIRDLEEAAK